MYKMEIQFIVPELIIKEIVCNDWIEELENLCKHNKTDCLRRIIILSFFSKSKHTFQYSRICQCQVCKVCQKNAIEHKRLLT